MQVGSALVSAVLIIVFIRLGYGLKTMSIIALSTNLASSLIMGILCKLQIKGLVISPKYWEKRILKGALKFSVFAYLITFSNLLIYRTDQIVVAAMLNVSLVAFYQISSRVAEFYRQFSGQFLDVLAPVSAMKYEEKNHADIQMVFINTSRLAILSGGFFFIPLFLQLDFILSEWLEYGHADGTIAARWLLFNMFFVVAFRSPMLQMLLMGGKEKLLAKIALIECSLNLLLSVILANYLGIIGVALGTVIPNLILGILFNIPYAVREFNVSWGSYFHKIIFKPVMVLGGLFVFMAGLLADGLPQILAGKFVSESFGWIEFFVINSIFTVMLGSASYAFVLNRRERKFFLKR